MRSSFRKKRCKPEARGAPASQPAAPPPSRRPGFLARACRQDAGGAAGWKPALRGLRAGYDSRQPMATSRSAYLWLLLLAACASPTAVVDQRSFKCAPGQDISIRAVLTHPAAAREAGGPLQYQVEVSNNSHSDVT